ncbi:hypothetical protein [Actinomadura gamaensis]|uniref:Uncharacterized protein n=1 Tax=Actinomadura gamaensis TaxID=1763541 RepID=A0ABV9U651_9ACTN
MNALRDDLEKITATPRPADAPGVSASLAVRRGRRIRHRRQALAAGATVLVVAAGAGVPTLVGSDGRQAPAVQAARGGYGTVLVKEATFGWLPGGYTTVRTGQGDDGYTLAAGTPKQKAGGLLLQLTRGAEPGIPNLPGGRPGHRTATEPVHGRPAYWVIKPGADGSDQVPADFRWQPADGRWAELVVGDKDVATEATVRRIVDNIRFGGGDAAAAFPLRLGGVPSGMRIARASVTPTSEMDLVLVPAHGTADADGFSVSLAPAQRDVGAPQAGQKVGDGSKDAKPKESGPNTRVARYPALYRQYQGSSTGSRGESVIVYGWHGMDLRIEALGRAFRALEASGGVRGMVGRTAYLGADQRKWTMTPLDG